MRVYEEPNVDLLRKKARVLEDENGRLSNRLVELLRENLALKGMEPEQVDLNLPALCAATSSSTAVTKPGSERRAKDDRDERPKKPQTGHGPSEQPDLPVVTEEFELDDADKICSSCGGELEEWKGHEDEVEVVDVIERRWILKKCKLKKYRCRCGGCIETALGPDKLIKGGRYSPEVAISAAVGKYVDHLPLERQVGMADRLGARLTNQALWDQTHALAGLLEPLYDRIKAFILGHRVIGVDESPFKLVKKGGSVKWQAWEISCPWAIHFSILSAKSAEMAAVVLAGFAGVIVVDGAAAYTSLAKTAAFTIANCWSHARRKVLAAVGEAPGQVDQFLELVSELYAIERKAARDPPGDDSRGGYRHLIDIDVLAQLRDTESHKVVAKIQRWILEQRCIPGGELKKSLTYVAKRWTALTRFLDDPLIPLDNNRTEGGYIGMAIGRRNYTGARSERGMRVAAVFYTIVESVKLGGGDPQAYLRYATDCAMRAQPAMLPHEWCLQEQATSQIVHSATDERL